MKMGSRLISMLLAVCLFTLGFGMSATAKGSPQHKGASTVSKKKEGKYKGGGKMKHHYKSSHYKNKSSHYRG